MGATLGEARLCRHRHGHLRADPGGHLWPVGSGLPGRAHGWGGFDQIDQPREDQWTYQAVAKIVLAHSLLRSLKEVDPDRTGVTGISWGGYLTCIVAGVDSRFKLAVPVYGCGFYRQTVFKDQLAKLSPEQADRWMAWWDPSAYLGGAGMPMLWVTGSNDFAYTLNALQPSYRLAQGAANPLHPAPDAARPRRSRRKPRGDPRLRRQHPQGRSTAPADHGPGTDGQERLGDVHIEGARWPRRS